MKAVLASTMERKITMTEDFGVQGRGAFFEEVGMLRDVAQNHMLQVIARPAMDAPAGRDPQCGG